MTQTFAPTRLIAGFVAGFLSVWIFSSVLIAIFYAADAFPSPPWSMMPVPPFGVPPKAAVSINSSHSRSGSMARLRITGVLKLGPPPRPSPLQGELSP